MSRFSSYYNKLYTNFPTNSHARAIGMYNFPIQLSQRLEGIFLFPETLNIKNPEKKKGN